MRDEHVGAVYAAKEKAGEMLAMCAALTEQAEILTGVVASATGGENCGSHSGRGAFERVARVPDLINDVAATLNEAVAELEVYIGEI